jgi:hypothetical protein
MSKTTINGATQIKSNSVPSGAVDSSIIVAAGSNAFSGNQALGGFNITGSGAPVNPGDLTPKSYVDAAIQGFTQKPTARLATAAALPAGTYANGTSGVGATFTVTATGTLTVDGILTALGDIILVKNQVSTFQNGLYTVTTAGAVGVAAVLTRHVNMDQTTEFDGALIPIDNEGSTNANTQWLTNNLGTVTVGTTAVTFTQLSSASAYTGTNGINVTGTVISPTYGVLINTICQGNDARLSDARTPVGTALTGAQIWIGNGSNLAVAVGLTGDITISNAGVTTANAALLRASNFVKRETPSGTINGSNVTFTLANTPTSGTEEVYTDGVQQDAGAGNDYTISGGTITFLTGSIPQTGDKVRVSYMK